MPAVRIQIALNGPKLSYLFINKTANVIKESKKNMKWKSEECGQYVVSTPHAIPLVIPAGQHGTVSLSWVILSLSKIQEN